MDPKRSWKVLERAALGRRFSKRPPTIAQNDVGAACRHRPIRVPARPPSQGSNSTGSTGSTTSTIGRACVAESVTPACVSKHGNDLVEDMLAHMESGVSPIALDHILDSRAILEVIEPARALGYSVFLTVVCPDNPASVIARVARRKEQGGHCRSLATIRQLFGDALLVAAEASLLADRTVLDGQQRPRLACRLPVSRALNSHMRR